MGQEVVLQQLRRRHRLDVDLDTDVEQLTRDGLGDLLVRVRVGCHHRDPERRAFLAPDLRGRVGGPPRRLQALGRGDGVVRVQVGGDSVDADHCVVAAPLPPLRAVDFVPALPTALAEAIASLQYGIGTKTLVQYDSRVWRDQGFDGDTFTDLPISTTWEATDGQPGRAGVLLVYTMGKPGAAFTSLPDASRIHDHEESTFFGP